MDLDAKLGLSALMVAAALAAGCSESSQASERVWLDVFNAYPGTSSMSMYGPSGAVATNLKFGQLSPGKPTAVDRNLGTDFKLLLDGAPTSFDVELPLYNLYPDETATVFFRRRSGAESVDAPVLFRHLRTGYQQSDRRCRLVFDNALSVKNDHVGQYNYLPVFKIRPSCAGYNLAIGESFDDSKELVVSSQGGGDVKVGRPGLYDRIANNPWFIPADTNSGELIWTYNSSDHPEVPPCGAIPPQKRGNGPEERPAGQNTIKWVWAGEGVEIDFSSGSFRAPPPSQQYMKCVGWDPDRPVGRQSIKSQQVEKCQVDQNKATPVKLNEETAWLDFQTGLGMKPDDEPVSNDTCGTTIRVSTDFFNVFNQKDNSQVERQITYPASQYYFLVLYGRPVYPRVHHWSVRPPRNAEGKPRGGGYVDFDPRIEGSSSN